MSIFMVGEYDRGGGKFDGWASTTEFSSRPTPVGS
jgi:hypothetical protein